MNDNAFFSWLRRSEMTRGDQRWVGGVCSGIAQRLGWDVALVRVLMILLTIVGAGLLVYPLAWLLLPNTRGEILLQDLFTAGRSSGEAIAALIVFIIGALSTAVTFWGLATVAAFFILVQHAVSQAEAPAPAAAPAGAFAQAAYVPPMAAPLPVVERERVIRTRRSAGPVVRLLVWAVIFLSAGVTYLSGQFIRISAYDYLAWARLWMMWGTAVTMALCILTLVLALMGRRSGGYAGLAAFGVVLCLIITTVAVGSSYAYESSYTLNYGRQVSSTYPHRVMVGNGETLKITKNLEKRLTEGVVFTSMDKFHTANVTLDLTDWESVMGKHTWTNYDGQSVESSCPAGTFNVNVSSVNLNVRVPRGCSYGSDKLGVITDDGGTGWNNRVLENVRSKYAQRFRDAFSEKKKELENSPNGTDSRGYDADDFDNFSFLSVKTDNDDLRLNWTDVGPLLGSTYDALEKEYEQERDGRLDKDIELHVRTLMPFGTVTFTEA
ncbi:hypothetical protein B9G54_05555 [Alloscardovia macacae]|uniref:PspC domain-containing protein n=1 Tax=Alloscardovia macacae TaxID=1160091 RepID=UPI000A2E1C98|nr:PspC domain-containing protein [Alloscardovia macacae]OTA26271.1 hypothetical protein B9G54_05555 [Alloscardovia macacae]